MPLSLSSLIRPVVVLGLLAVVSAIGFSRAVPRVAHRRVGGGPSLFLVNDYLADLGARGSHAFDADRDPLVPQAVSDDGALDNAGLSPWTDERGRSQVIGRWTPRGGGGGLARSGFPGGESLDRVATDRVPISPACGFPGAGVRTLFAAADGQLYTFTFESAAAEPEPTAITLDAGRDAKPSPLTWQPGAIADPDVFLAEPFWPRGTGFERTIVATVRRKLVEAGRPRYGPSRLHRLVLDAAGRSIESASPLLDRESDDLDERCPSVIRGADGRLALAYFLARDPAGKSWDLRVAPITPSPTDLAISDPGTVVATRCRPSQVVGSADGHRLAAIRLDPGDRATVVHLPLPDRAATGLTPTIVEAGD